MPRSTVCAALAALLVALPSVAEAKTFHGKTNQGRSVRFVTDANGVPSRVNIHWSAPCKRSGYRAGGGTAWVPPFTQATPDLLRDGPKTYRTTLTNGSKGRITTTLVAHRHGSRWTGTLALRELVSHKGKVVDTCQIKRLRFSVH